MVLITICFKSIKYKMVVTRFDSYFVFFFYNIDLECQCCKRKCNGEAGEDPVGVSLSLEICPVISVRADCLPARGKHQ